MRSGKPQGHTDFGDLAVADSDWQDLPGTGALPALSTGGLHTVQRVRQQLEALVLPEPHRVPRLALPPGECAPGAWRQLQALAAAAAQSDAADPRLIALTQQALHLLPAGGLTPAMLAARPCTEAPDPHDAYFRVVRTGEDGGLVWLRALLGGLQCYLGELHGSRVAPDQAVIGEALCGLWATAMGLSTRPAAPPLQAMVHWQARQALPLEPAVRRWLRGHQVFAVLTQGLIATLASLRHAVAAGPATGVALALARMTLLYRASAAAFRFTADFDPAHYTGAIRPSMSEPHVPSGFSGTLSSDHGHLVRQLSALRAPLARARALCPAGYQAMAQALALVYDDHRRVCEHFDGAQRPSLLTGSHSGDRAAADMLDRFKVRRVGMLA